MIFYTKYKLQDTRYKSSRSARKAFTLMELLIYSGILVISAGLISSIVFTVSRANLKAQVNEALNSQSIRFEEIFRQKIEIAKGINSMSGSDLSLEMSDANKNPTVFSFSDDIVYIKEGSGGLYALNDSDQVKVTSSSFSLAGAPEASISSNNHYAWSNGLGWIDFAYTGGNVKIPMSEGDLKGLAYVLSDGSWISLNCISTDSCYDAVNNPTGIDYKVSSDANGNLSDWAWSESFGWISFSCTTGGSDGGNICCSQNPPPCSDYGVTVATSTGEFDGYAFSENIDWISFNCKTGGESQANICETASNYRVQDMRLRTSAIKVDITLQYNSEKAELAVSRTNAFVFNILTPSK